MTWGKQEKQARLLGRLDKVWLVAVVDKAA